MTDPRLVCPVCTQLMVPETAADIALDRCPSCAGLWFDPLELERYIRIPGRAGRAHLRTIEAVPGAERLPCPRCEQVSLKGLRAGPIYLSLCVTCRGVYLDGADLRALDGRRLRLLPNEPQLREEMSREEIAETMLGLAAQAVLTFAPF